MPEPQRLKIGFVLDDSLDRPDGVQQYVLTVGEWLRSQGQEVHYLVSTTVRRDVANIHDMTANVGVNFNGNHVCTPLPANRKQIADVLDAHHFDILHVQMPYSPVFAGRIIEAADNRTAVIGTFHIIPRTPLVAYANRLLAWWSSKTLKRFDAIMSVSPAAQDFARRTFGIASTVLPNPIWLQAFREAAPFSSPKQRPLNILFVGRLVPRKGCKLLLQAAVLLRDQHGDQPFRIIICGKGPLAAELMQFARNNQLEHIVTFKGFIAEADKPRYYASADITVFPSNGGESFGIVLAEAMASGRAAVLAGDNPGYRSVLGDCPGDVLFDPLDANALAEQLHRLVIDPAMRRHIAAWQRQHAVRYDVKRIGLEVYKAYLSALRHKHNVR